MRTRRILKLARVNGEDCVYDLGCGDGRICVAAAKLGASAVGVEIEPDLVAEFEKAVETEQLRGRVRCVCGGAPCSRSPPMDRHCTSQLAIYCFLWCRLAGDEAGRCHSSGRVPTAGGDC